MVVDAIRQDYPHIRVIGEEGNSDLKEAEYAVIVDPVDGTLPFSHGIPLSTFVISVTKDGKPIAAVIYNPFMDCMWHATRGEGTFLNDKRTKVSKCRDLKDSLISIIPWWGAPENLLGVCQKLEDRKAKWVNLFSIAHLGGFLASGEVEASIFSTEDVWETSAMQLIAEEAGGKATDLFGNPLYYGTDAKIKGHIISNGVLHDELIELVREGIANG